MMTNQMMRDVAWFQSHPRTCPVCFGTEWDEIAAVPEPFEPHSLAITWSNSIDRFALPNRRLRARCARCDTLLFIPLEPNEADAGT